jgi:hypothetical protein
LKREDRRHRKVWKVWKGPSQPSPAKRSYCGLIWGRGLGLSTGAWLLASKKSQSATNVHGVVKSLGTNSQFAGVAARNVI